MLETIQLNYLINLLPVLIQIPAVKNFNCSILYQPPEWVGNLSHRLFQHVFVCAGVNVVSLHFYKDILYAVNTYFSTRYVVVILQRLHMFLYKRSRVKLLPTLVVLVKQLYFSNETQCIIVFVKLPVISYFLYITHHTFALLIIFIPYGFYLSQFKCVDKLNYFH